ncbi:tetratricopeptide repeat protein [Marivirga tractuosa]|uniref:ATP-binding protein n=1 Tax=Marivirga tractuosa TaxID=1006 RepID=UPI0035D094F6
MKGKLYYIIFIFFTSIFFYSKSIAQEKEQKSEVMDRIHALLDDFDTKITSEPARAKSLINQAIVLSKEYSLEIEEANSYFRLGKLLLNEGNYDSSKVFLKKSLTTYLKQKDYKGISKCYKEIGVLLEETGHREESLTHYTKGLKIARDHDFNELIPPFINNIGTIYLKQQHYEKASELFKESASLSKEGYQYAITINNIGVVKYQQGLFDEARDYYKKSLEACNNIKDDYCSLTPLNGIANTYLQQNAFEKALKTTQKAIQIQKRKKLDKDLLVSYNRLGLTYNAMGEYIKAIEEYERSLRISKKINSIHTPYIHANISDCYQNLRDYKNALSHSKKFYELKDSINSLEYKIKTEELLAQYETEKKDKEIELLRKNKALREIQREKEIALYEQELLNKSLEEQENKYELLQRDKKIDLLNKNRELQKANIINQENELKRQALIKNIVIVSSITILIPVIILLIVYRQKVKSREQLAAKTEEVNQQKTLELIREFEIKTIRAQIEGQENEKKRIAKELHDGIAGGLAAIKMNLQSLDNTSNQNLQLKKLIKGVDAIYSEVRTISHNLTPPEMLNHSFADFLKKYLSDVSEIATFKIEYIFHNEKILNKLQDHFKVEIYRILQELITNIIKHAKTDFVEIQILTDDNNINLIVDERW